ncbi:hypothetical protein ENBRE01_0867 [Enteropsectra breve]|nr:hypothetical protein ENBRE01_0867 [Enteropsectra breve]
MLGFLVNAFLAGAVFFNIHHCLKFTDKQSRKHYKYYFIVMSLVLALDNMLSFVLYKIPYYRVFKMIFLAWMSVPGTTAPKFIYNFYIKNAYQLFEGDIDSVVNNLRGYKADIQNWYQSVLKGVKKGELEISLDSKSEKSVKDKVEESSDMEATTSVMSDNEEQALKN